ncbi:membrane protein insertion efficiency factor YidD [Longibacter salinarum]|uniref:Putative membrane protein insertion efficiency factor n=1 Tax=Longibacter salinarum TaxID=1850348 RepID=A0A2A8CYX8_9BACT|nr:membrane protein insertion efficiency factor YidD [Longibacter salinarum]PEN13824.1 membrane protein insertion efficiency factor YidD [Longibacter salinarum]
MSQFLSFLYRLPRLAFVGLVRGYQLLLSPHLPPTCRFQPTCSTYSIQAFREYGAVKGLILTIYRLGRCHPWGGYGYDPPRWFGESLPHEECHHASDPSGTSDAQSPADEPVSSHVSSSSE